MEDPPATYGTIPSPRRPRIAFLNPQGGIDAASSGIGEHPDFGGQLVYVRELCLALAARHRVDVDIVTRQFFDPRWPTFSSPAEILGIGDGGGSVRVVRLPCGPQGFVAKERLWPHLGSWVAGIVSFYARDGGLPDAAAGQYADGGLACAMLQAAAGVPFACFTAHSLGAPKLDVIAAASARTGDSNGAHAPEALSLPYRLAAERICIRAARRIVVSTYEERRAQYGHDAYADAVDVEAERYRFVRIHPGINSRVFGPKREDEEEIEEGDQARRAVQVFEDAVRRDVPPSRWDLPLVVVAGRLDYKKNHIGVVRAFADDPDLERGANLVMMVKGGPRAFVDPGACFAPAEQDELWLVRQMHAIMLEAGLLGRCVVAPGLRNTQRELGAVFRHLGGGGAERRAIFCHLAHHEPFGLMVLEAVAAGLPAVCTRNGGPAESLLPDLAVLVDPVDMGEVSRALRELIIESSTSPERWRQRKTKAQAQVLRRYSWDAAADRYLAVIMEGADSRVEKELRQSGVNDLGSKRTCSARVVR